MTYLIQRAGNFYYNRSVPVKLRTYDPRRQIRIALNTDSRKKAAILAVKRNEEIEAYWKTLVDKTQTQAQEQYKALVQRAWLLGFTYHDIPTLAGVDVEAIKARLQHIEKVKFAPSHIEAVLGAAPAPVLMLQDVLSKYWDIAKSHILNKTPQQITKWELPRKKAMANFISCVGNKPLAKLTREDTLGFRDWWIERLKTGKYVSATANKDLKLVKTIVSTVAENFKINIECEHLFKKLLLKRNDAKRRLPFTTEYLRKVLLAPESLQGLEDEAKAVVYAFAETGAGLSELTVLSRENIILDADIPYIDIKSRSDRCLKTEFRERKIPLVGFALDAFKAYPDGFISYKDNHDILTTLISHYFSRHKLLPSDRHCLYSLRHSLQDRLLAEKVLDRVQAEIMGHKYQRPNYGDGASLEQKFEAMQKIQLKQI